MNGLKLTAIDIVETELRLERAKHAPPRKKCQRQRAGNIRVRATLRPTPNYDLLARALIDYA